MSSLFFQHGTALTEAAKQRDAVRVAKKQKGAGAASGNKKGFRGGLMRTKKVSGITLAVFRI